MSKAHPMHISIVVPVFNKADLLIPTLDSIVEAAAMRPGTDIICVDNGSTDGSRQILDRYAANVTIIDSTASTISGVRNEGARRSIGTIVVFFDADVLVPVTYLSRLLEVFDATEAAAVGCEYALPPHPTWVERVWYELNVRDDDGDRTYINGGNIAVQRQAFDAVGGWPEYLNTSEDYEFCRVLVAAGHRVYQAQAVTVAHLGNPKTLTAFFGKMRWHGLGMLAARAPGARLNLPTLSTLAHVALLVLAAGVILVPTPLSWPARFGGAIAMASAVPIATYCYRLLTVRRLVAPLPAYVLLQTFFLGRASAIFSSVVSGSTMMQASG